MIKTRSASITPDQIRSIRVQPGEVLHCSVDVGDLQVNQAAKLINLTRGYLLELLPEGTKLLVTSDKVSFTVIQP